MTEAVSHVFQLEDNKCHIIVKHLKTEKKASGQVRLALLIGIKQLAEEGIPNIPNEELRKLCTEHAVFDNPNFAANMKKNKNLFLPQGRDWKLTKPGENEAANLIKELVGVSYKE